jgi:hypothetical protein
VARSVCPVCGDAPVAVSNDIVAATFTARFTTDVFPQVSVVLRLFAAEKVRAIWPYGVICVDPVSSVPTLVGLMPTRCAQGQVDLGVAVGAPTRDEVAVAIATTDTVILVRLRSLIALTSDLSNSDSVRAR